jgi:hypothetical protein
VTTSTTRWSSPTDDARYRQLEMFVPRRCLRGTRPTPHAVPDPHPAPAIPAELVSTGGGGTRRRLRRPDRQPSAVRRGGTGVRPSRHSRRVPALHPSTAEPHCGPRYSMHLSYRPAGVEWAQRHPWADHSHEPGWYDFAVRATPRQLALVGFPPPGHSYWPPETPPGSPSAIPTSTSPPGERRTTFPTEPGPSDPGWNLPRTTPAFGRRAHSARQLPDRRAAHIQPRRGAAALTGTRLSARPPAGPRARRRRRHDRHAAGR